MNLPIVRAGFEGSGSPRWLMRTMQLKGFDRARGFALDLQLLDENRHRHGTLQALAEGRVDVVDADRQALTAAQADGLPLVAIAPYGRILGSLVVHRNYRGAAQSSDTGLATLRGSRLGVLSMHDKNGQLLLTACRQLAGFDLARTVTVMHYKQRADLVAALSAGAIDAALLHWHLVPPLVAAGHRILAELPDLADALADVLAKAPAKVQVDALTGPAPGPTTFFVVQQQLTAHQPARVAAFVAATTDAIATLRDDASAWQALATEGAVDTAHLDAMRTRWHDRVGAFHPNATRSLMRSNPCNPF